MRLLLATLLLATAPLAQSSWPAELAELSPRWQRLVDAGVVPGLAVCVVEGDELLHLEALGWRDPTGERPVTPETMFYIASATKPFVAMACTILAEEDRLDLDAPLRDYLPRFALADEGATAAITVRDLLCHRPGINSGPIVFLDAYTGQITEDRYYHFLSSVQPSGRVTYTNVHFTLAGRVVEAVTGTPWKDALRELVFEPAGMPRTTGYADWMYAQEDVALPSELGEGGWRRASVRKNTAVMHAAGGLGTSILDLAAWLRVHLSEGLGQQRVVSAAGLREMLREQSSAPEGELRAGVSGFGLGWMRGEAFGQLELQHGGGYIGTAARVSFLPEPGIGLAVLVNGDGLGQNVCQLVRDDVYAFLLAEPRGRDPLEGLIERVARERRRAGTTEASGPNPARAEDALTLAPEAYVGEYGDEWFGTARIELVDGELVGRMGNASFTLHSLGGDRFEARSRAPIAGEAEFLLEERRVVGVRLNLIDREVELRR